MTDAPTERERENTWARLRRRKVVQWGLVYVAAAWGLLQGLAYVSDAFQWPAQLRQVALLALLIGMPIAVVLAYYHGDRGQQRITTPEFAILTLLLLLGGGAFWYYQRASETVSPVAPPPASAASAADHSIAVLPFVNMSTDKEQEYFADGISEELLNLLAQIPELRVIARTSSFSFKGKEVDIAEIARRLNVANVLEGSVRKSGDTLRITAQLVRASDSSHLWSRTYDRQMTDVFKVQDEIAAAVVRQLKVALLGGELPTRSTTTSLEAYNLYLRARYLFDQHSSESMAKAVEHYEKALTIDPGYAEGWAALAEAQVIRADEGLTDVTFGAQQARASARRALDLNPQLAKAHYALGMVQFIFDWDWFAAEASLKKAIALDPSETRALTFAAGLALALGRTDAAIDLAQQAVVHNPLGAYERLNLGSVYALSARLDDAEKEIRTTLDTYPEYESGSYWLGLTLLLKGQAAPALEVMLREPVELWRLAGLPLVYHRLGQMEASNATLREEIDKHASGMAYQIAQAYAYRGEVDKAFAWLDRAYRQRDSGLAWYPKSDPLLQNIRSDPRYTALLRKLKLPER